MGKEKQKMVLIGVCAVVLLGLIVYFGIVQTYKKIGDTKKKIEAKDAEIRGYQDKINQIPKLKERRNAIQGVLEEFVRILPDNAMDEHFALLGMINDYKNETNIEMDRFDPVEEKRKQKGEKETLGFIQQQFRLEVEGQFFDLARLLNLIERTEKFLRIDSFRLSRPEASERPGGDLSHLKAEITMSTFTYKEPKQSKQAR